MEALVYYYYNLRAKLVAVTQVRGALRFYLGYYFKEIGKGIPDVLIVSYPKSGRTWIEQIIRVACCKEWGIDEDLFRTLNEMDLRGRGTTDIHFTHAESSWESRLRNEKSIKRKPPEAFRARKYVFLYRDPRDVLVSSYYHLKHRTGLRHFSQEKLLASKIVGPRKIINFMNHWNRFAKEQPERVLRMQYEQMRTEPFEAMRRFFDFCQMTISDESIRFAIEACAFKRMQAKEASGDFKNPWLSRMRKDDPNSGKVRKGKSGEYREFFTPEQVESLNRLLDEDLDKAFPYHASNQ